MLSFDNQTVFDIMEQDKRLKQSKSCNIWEEIHENCNYNRQW